MQTPSQIEQVPVERLIPYARNARLHSDAQVASVAASMREFGFTNPVLIDGNDGIIAGHCRVLAARKLNMASVPCLRLGYLTETQKRAYILADNKLALNSEWSVELLALELKDLALEGFDVGLAGFATDELLDILGTTDPGNDKDPDELPDVPEVAFPKLGDMWTMGAHRLLCGDATQQKDWDTLMQGELADLQVCDPPYNVAYEGSAGTIKNDNMADAEFRQFLLSFYQCSFRVMKPGAAMYVAHADTEAVNFRTTFVDAGFKASVCLIWQKNSLVLGRSDYQMITEPILYGWKPGSKHKWYGGRKNVTVQDVGDRPPFEKLADGNYVIRAGDRLLYVKQDAVVEEQPTSILYCDKPKRSPMHPTTKPVALWERLMRNSARPGDLVVDGFGGSGTTLIAADRLGMSSRLIEFDPRFVDTIVTRWQQWSGRKAVNAVTGEPFPEEVSARLVEKWGGG